MLPYIGIPSFARSEIVSLDSDWHADVAVIGIPFDIAVGFRPGQRFAPRAIRQSSLRYALPRDGFFDFKTKKRILEGIKMVDAGDVDLPSLEDAIARERITQSAVKIRQKTTLPIFLGGDHSITYPVLRAFDRKIHIVQFDAHLDFSFERDSTRFSNSSPFRRISEALEIDGITVIGLRGLRFDQEAVEKADFHTLLPIWNLDKSQLPQNKDIYISFDVDVFDPGFFPATSSPEPDGLTFGQSIEFLQEIIKNNRLIGLDLVELLPEIDANSSLFASRLLMEIISMWWQTK